MGFFDFLKQKKEPTAMDAMKEMLFPNGYDDVKRGGQTVQQLAHNKLSKQESEKLYSAVTTLFFIAEDKSESRIKPSIAMRAGGKLSDSEVSAIYKYIGGCADTPYGEGAGTKESPLVINHTGSSLGVNAEYEYLAQRYGERDKDWKVSMRSHGSLNNRHWELIVVETKDGRREEVYFDITNFYGK